MEMIQSMVSLVKLLKTFWGEVMRTTVDVLNLSPTVPLEGDVPERVWRGNDVSYKYLRVFGSHAFINVLKDKRFKLDAELRQCIFLGYTHDEFGHRLWDPKRNKIIRSRDVIIFEDQTLKDIKKGEKPRPSPDVFKDANPSPPPTIHDDEGEDAVDQGVRDVNPTKDAQED